MTRNYDFEAGPLDEGYRVWVREHITITGEHVARITVTQRNRKTAIVRFVLRSDGSLLFGPIEEFREHAHSGPWLPPLFSWDDSVAVLLTPS